jgi:DNA replication ATP-dependent helicase Dna2
MSILSPDSAQYYYEQIIAIEASQGPKQTDKFKDLRTVLDSLFKELTSQEKQYFQSTFSRSSYVFDKYNVASDVREEINGFRKKANDVVHTVGADVSDDELLAGMRALSLAISHFEGEPIPESLHTRFVDKPELTFRRKGKRNHTHIKELELIVTDVQHDSAVPYKTTLRGDAGEYGDVTILLYSSTDPERKWLDNFATAGKLLSKFTHVAFYDIQLNEGTENVFSTRPTSIMVVEPDYLIEASKIAECFDRGGINQNIYLLGKFKQSETDYRMMLGNVANNILDRLALSPNTAQADIRAEPMSEQAFGLLCVSQQGGRFNPAMLDSMHNDAAPHIGVIAGVLENYKKHKLLIEPTYFSTRFGLHGRLDMMAQDPADDKRKNIVELKSGSAPGINYNDGLWNNNKAQVQCYNMLLESTFPGRTGDSAILYSNPANNDGQPLRNHAESGQLRQELMMLRNLIVLNDFLLAEDPAKVLARFNPENFGPRAKFDEEPLQGIWTAMKSAAPYELRYFRDFVGFVAREQRTAKIGSDEVEGTPGFAALWRSARNDKRNTFSILDYLEFDKLTEHSEVYLKRGLLSDKMSNLREGDITILYPFVEGDEQAAIKNQILKCNIKRINDREVVVALRSKTMDADYFKKHPYWALERDLMEKGFDGMYTSLACFLQTPKPKRDLLFGLRAPEFGELNYAVAGNLSDEQRKLMECALSAKDYFLLQGPPGTGKTSYMLRNMVQNLHDSTEENIMVMAFTNSAVEEICRHLDKAGLQHIRLSRSGSAANCFNKMAEQKTVIELNEQIEKTRIFVCTQASFGGFSHLAKLKKFDTVIIDEASQLLEPHLVGILPLFGRFILIGDEKQLPAVVTQADKYTKVEDPELTKIHLKSLKNSLFSRLLATCQVNGWDNAYGMLTKQGRMHQDICAYISQEYYENRLQPYPGDQFAEQTTFKADSTDKYERALAKSRIVFIPAAREPKAKVSETEARIVAGFIKTVHKIYGENFSRESVGVVTPYRSQIATIKRSGTVEEAIMQQVDVDTVERFQGNERDVIIISLAVNHPKQMQFLESLTDDGKVDRKLNVALTRAKKQVVVVGCESVLRSSSSYRKLLEYITETGGYVNLDQV